jgi:hypothetical protein
MSRIVTVGLTALPPSVSLLCRQCGILNISQPYRPPRPVTGIAVTFYWLKHPLAEGTHVWHENFASCSVLTWNWRVLCLLTRDAVTCGRNSVLLFWFGLHMKAVAPKRLQTPIGLDSFAFLKNCIYGHRSERFRFCAYLASCSSYRPRCSTVETPFPLYPHPSHAMVQSFILLSLSLPLCMCFNFSHPSAL